MFNTLKALHRGLDLAKAKAAELIADAESAKRHIEALVPALTAEEKSLYDAFLKERDQVLAKV